MCGRTPYLIPGNVYRVAQGGGDAGRRAEVANGGQVAAVAHVVVGEGRPGGRESVQLVLRVGYVDDYLAAPSVRRPVKGFVRGAWGADRGGVATVQSPPADGN